MRKIILTASIALLVYCIFVWFLGSRILHLHDLRLLVLRLSLWFIGIAAAGVVVWFFWHKKKQEEAEEFPEEPADIADIEQLIRDAEGKLAAAQLEKGGKLGSLPGIFIIGDPGTAKTTTIVNSGLDPELLAGQVYRDNNLVPTRALNLWYAQHAFFIEGAGSTVAQPGVWAKIARRLQPGRLNAAMGGGQSPRAALVTIDGESLTGAGATNALAGKARILRSRLGEISQSLGINLPVYVLFTKMDRVPFFAEFVRNLTPVEAVQVLGVTVPIARAKGVYAEQETARLGSVFEQLFRSLCNARPMLLEREYEPAQLPGIYEFPREFHKLRAALTQFLVDLCRPSQLSVGPFLRGFYFSGVRPIILNEVAAAPVRSPSQTPGPVELGATRIFRVEDMAPTAEQPAAQVVGSRKVPQWVFLTRLFHELLLADRAAMGASGSSTKTSLLRRVLLASAAGLLLIYSIGAIFSYVRNRALETTALNAARDLQSVQPGGLKLASLDSLRSLEILRQSLVTLTDYHRNGAPWWKYHLGLYTVEELYPRVRRIYFDKFRRVMFGQTQSDLVGILSKLPATPGPEFLPTYDTLKAYLITTSNPEKSTRAFLSPALLNRWSAGKTVDPDSLQLAQKQFDFYSDELPQENPFTSVNDQAAIAKARRYLNQFAGVERVYAAMLADARKETEPINFNKKYPGSAETLVDVYEVSGPFTKAGWDFMRNAFKNPERYFSGEQWVLGDQGAANIDRANLSKQLADRYNSDFIKQWRAYLRSASVVKYASVQDAATKLNMLSGNQSSLLALFSLASTHTAVDEPEVLKVFQPVQEVVPPNSDRFIGGKNQGYMNALLQLQTSVDKAASLSQLNDVVVAQVLNDAGAARITTRQLAQTFRVDPDGRVDSMVGRLMEDPITSVELLFKKNLPAELNAKGKDVCAEYRRLMAKYPFKPDPTVAQATVPDVNGVFGKPEGKLWKFYNESLEKLLPKQGGKYVPAGSPGVTLTPAFVSFFNQAAEFSEAIYAGGATDPHIAFSLKPLPSEGIQTVGLKLDGQDFNYSGGDSTPKQFTWQTSGVHEAKATVKFGGTDLGWSNYSGLWAIWRFFADAENWQPVATGVNLEWRKYSGRDRQPVTFENGKQIMVLFQLDMGGAPQVFDKTTCQA